jgi:hypothetical protein
VQVFLVRLLEAMLVQDDRKIFSWCFLRFAENNTLHTNSAGMGLLAIAIGAGYLLYDGRRSDTGIAST